MKKSSKLIGFAAGAVLVFAALPGCSEAVGDCVTIYRDGDRFVSHDFSKSECTSSCAERMGPGGTGENVIASCFFDGSIRSVTGIE